VDAGQYCINEKKHRQWHHCFGDRTVCFANYHGTGNDISIQFKPNLSGSPSVASDSWLAAEFGTGTDASGYVLNSVQLGMTDASGNPSGFTEKAIKLEAFYREAA
jgi:hypothetical protein